MDQFSSTMVMVNKYVNAHYGYLAEDVKQDMYQEGYIGLLEGLQKFKPQQKSNLQSWLYFYVRHRVTDYARRFSRTKLRGQQYQQEVESFQEEAPTCSVQEALHSLKAEDRKLVQGYYIQGYDLQQVSKLNGISRSVCSRRLAQARLQLKEYLSS